MCFGYIENKGLIIIKSCNVCDKIYIGNGGKPVSYCGYVYHHIDKRRSIYINGCIIYG